MVQVLVVFRVLVLFWVLVEVLVMILVLFLVLVLEVFLGSGYKLVGLGSKCKELRPLSVITTVP